jgi:hypothetical protein
MPEPWTESPPCVGKGSKLRIGVVAARQAGRITTAQLRRLDVSETTIGNWTRGGYLYRRLPRVYAVGQPGATIEGTLWEAVLFAGPGAMLSHMSAAWWQGLILHPPSAIHASTPRRTRSRPGLVIHGRRRLERSLHRGIPVTPARQTIFDLAGAGQEPLVRRALAVLDFQGRLDADSLVEACGQGRPGSALLRSALGRHDPRYARTLSVLEDDFLSACEAHDIPRPDAINVRINGILCDAVYREARIIVELDGVANHQSPAQIRRDRANDLVLRAHGWLVLRYSWAQVHEDPGAIREEIRRELSRRLA